MGGSTSSYATAGIALGVSGTLKSHHDDKVEIPYVGINASLAPLFRSSGVTSQYCFGKSNKNEMKKMKHY
jgi:hypothetical protein